MTIMLNESVVFAFYGVILKPVENTQSSDDQHKLLITITLVIACTISKRRKTDREAQCWEVEGITLYNLKGIDTTPSAFLSTRPARYTFKYNTRLGNVQPGQCFDVG